MYGADRMSNVRAASENPVCRDLYDTILAGDNAHRLLHYK